ncbi:hypothetical protein TD95_002274 [Thielaviopsis punctulata]|uniref:MARVEL domain-containing protein n=1 Tax=Thielaviopsis punctulata TaxID=72032 RepID=A0A0F4ZKQ1_9PEZI|nr:hypothetical protein TD95_002274 [Thielaviopsis punctulata]
MAPRACFAITRGLQFALAVVVLVFAIIVAQYYTTETEFSSPSQINFLVFTPIFSFISLVYLVVIPKIAPQIFYPWPSLILEGLNVLFYFAGSIAWAVFLSSLSFCGGSVCTSGKLAAITGGAQFFLWSATLIGMSRDIFGWGRKPRGPVAGSNPMMAQV